MSIVMKALMWNAVLTHRYLYQNHQAIGHIRGCDCTIFWVLSYGCRLDGRLLVAVTHTFIKHLFHTAIDCLPTPPWHLAVSRSR